MNKIKTLLLSVSSFTLFVSCSPKSFEATVDTPFTKLSNANLDGGNAGNTGNPDNRQINPDNVFGPGSGSANLTPAEIQKLCPWLESVDRPTAASLSTAPSPIGNLLITGAGNSSYILGLISRLTIDSYAGEIVAKAETLVSLSSFAGQARISALQAGPIRNFAGSICLSTNSVGNISDGAGELHIIGPKTGMGQGGDISNRAGETYISDLKLGKISNMAGQLTVVGGSIQTLAGGAGQVTLDHVQIDTIDATQFAGEIILQNGSSVRNATGGHIVYK